MTGAEAPLLDEDHAEDALRALAEQLRRELDQGAQAAQAVDLDDPIGRLSRMDAIQQQQMAAAGHRATALRLRQVEAALQRVAQGTWGTCVACGEPIDARRLTARPEVPFCRACQAAREG